MNQFYVCIVFIGIMLIVFSLVLIAYDRKKSLDYRSKFDEKKEELTAIISDADQMIEEMNKFSDYIVSQMELKNDEMSACLKMVEDKMKHMRQESSERIDREGFIQERVVNGSSIEMLTANEAYSSHMSNNIGFESIKDEKINPVNNSEFKTQLKVKDKVVPFNNKTNSVLQLAKMGLNHTEIAKSLKMGKGEVQLIIEMNK